MWGIGSVRTVGVVRGRVYGVSNVNSLKNGTSPYSTPILERSY